MSPALAADVEALLDRLRDEGWLGKREKVQVFESADGRLSPLTDAEERHLDDLFARHGHPPFLV